MFDWEDYVPVLALDYVAVFDGELLEVFWLDVAVVLWVWMCKDEWLEIHSLGCTVAEEDVKARVSMELWLLKAKRVKYQVVHSSIYYDFPGFLSSLKCFLYHNSLI